MTTILFGEGCKTPSRWTWLVYILLVRVTWPSHISNEGLRVKRHYNGKKMLSQMGEIMIKGARGAKVKVF
jgi:hypothetical protein